MSKTVCYCRVSSNEQADSPTSLPSQVSDLLKFCRQNGIDLDQRTNCLEPGVWVDPGVSARKVPVFERPGFVAMWAILEPGDTIVVHSLDRMFRSVLDFARSYDLFDKRNIRIRFMVGDIDMSSASGRMVAAVLAAFAQFKSDLMSERIREGHAAKKRARAEGTKFEPAAGRKVHPVTTGRVPASLDDLPPAVDVEEKGRIWAYARVSSDGQTCESQKPAIERLSARYRDQGFSDPDGILEERSVSAYKVNWKDRPIGKMIWKNAKKGDVVVAARLDRMFRSFFDMCFSLQEMERRGVLVRIGDDMSTDTPVGRMMLGLLGVMAEWESAELSRRLKLARKFCRDLYGKWIEPFNLPQWMRAKWLDEKTWVAVPDYRVLRDMIMMTEMVDTGMTARQVSDVMEKIIAERSGRLIIPMGGMKANIMVLRSKTPEQKKCTRKWLTDREIKITAHVRRPMSFDRVSECVRNVRSGPVHDLMESAKLTRERIFEMAAQIDLKHCQKGRTRKVRDGKLCIKRRQCKMIYM